MRPYENVKRAVVKISKLIFNVLLYLIAIFIGVVIVIIFAPFLALSLIPVVVSALFDMCKWLLGGRNDKNGSNKYSYNINGFVVNLDLPGTNKAGEKEEILNDFEI